MESVTPLSVLWPALRAALPALGAVGIGLAWGWLVGDRVYLERRSIGDLLLTSLLLAGFVLWFAGGVAAAGFLGAAAASLALCVLWRRQLGRRFPG